MTFKHLAVAIFVTGLPLLPGTARAQSSYNTFNGMPTARGGLTGSQIPILPRTVYSFTGGTAGAPTASVVLANHINIASARDLTVLIRYHPGTTGTVGTTFPAGAQVIFSLLIEAPTADDPLSDYTVAYATTSAILAIPGGNLTAMQQANTLPTGSFARLVATIQPGVSGNPFILNISADIVTKS